MSIFYQNRLERFRFFTSTDITFGAHLHRHVELLVVLEGTLRVTLDHQEYDLKEGHGIIIFPNKLHSLRTIVHSRILLCIFDIDYCHNYLKYFQTLQPLQPLFCLQDLGAHSQIAIKGLLGLTGGRHKSAPIPDSVLNLSEGYLVLLLASLFEKLPLEEKGTSCDLELEQKLLIYIDSHYMEPLSLEILSKEFGISRFSLSRLFSDRLHVNFTYYVNSKRLESALVLLADSTLSITQIALDSGFGSSRTFFREFQEHYGMTPGEYRKKNVLPSA